MSLGGMVVVIAGAETAAAADSDTAVLERSTVLVAGRFSEIVILSIVIINHDVAKILDTFQQLLVALVPFGCAFV